jgi:uncharacterized protein with PIN domain
MFGLDVELRDMPLLELVRRGLKEGRWVLTRRAQADGLGALSVPVMRIVEDRPDRQVIQVLRRLSAPVSRSRWFWRCIVCNAWLEEMPKERAVSKVPDHVALSHDCFRECPCCGRVYWPGSHRENMLRSMESWARQAWGVVPP